jgi:hypothetical protein
MKNPLKDVQLLVEKVPETSARKKPTAIQAWVWKNGRQKGIPCTPTPVRFREYHINDERKVVTLWFWANYGELIP